MGAQASVVDTVHIFIAIFAHKGLAAYALGSSLVDSGASKRRFWVVIGIFSLATPAGIGLGRIVASYSQGGAASALSALASGRPPLKEFPKVNDEPTCGSSFSILAAAMRARFPYSPEIPELIDEHNTDL